jgi:plastocyanin
MNKRKLVLGLVIATVVAAAGILIYPLVFKPAPEPEPKTNDKVSIITITDEGFEPATLLVKKGTAVTWVSKDDETNHQVASNPYPKLDGPLKSESLSDGGHYTYTFNQPGKYEYHDHLNPVNNATVIVE